MSDQRLHDLDRKIRCVAHTLVRLGEDYKKLVQKMYPDAHPGYLQNFAQNAVIIEKRSMEEDRHQQFKIQQMLSIAEDCRERGEDPEKVYDFWVWKDGQPTGEIRE